MGSWKDSSSEGLASNSIVGPGYELDLDLKSRQNGNDRSGVLAVGCDIQTFGQTCL